MSGAGSGLLVLSFLIDSRSWSIALNIVALTLLTLALVRFFATGKASDQDRQEGR